MRSGLIAGSFAFRFPSFVFSLLFLVVAIFAVPSQAQNSEQLEVGPPPLHRAAPPAAGASAEELEKQGDELRTDKNFLDALEFYQAEMQKSPGNQSVYRKIGVCQLMMQRYKDAKKSFEKAIHADHKDAIAYNNLGVVYYTVHSYK
jgi:tetratricopeptide (TPR) repeat protein